MEPKDVRYGRQAEEHSFFLKGSLTVFSQLQAPITLSQA
jgi:hypothetical protein